MMGYVSTEPREPRLLVEILGDRGAAIPLEITVDTGFTGFMTLPEGVINTFGLKQNRSRKMRLADGRVRQFQSYFATILWHGKPVTISAVAMPGKPLIGMSLLWNNDVVISARENGQVSVTEIGGSP